MLEYQAKQYQIYSFYLTVNFLVFIYLNHNKKMGVLFILKMIQAKFVAILMENFEKSPLVTGFGWSKSTLAEHQ